MALSRTDFYESILNSKETKNLEDIQKTLNNAKDLPDFSISLIQEYNTKNKTSLQLRYYMLTSHQFEPFKKIVQDIITKRQKEEADRIAKNRASSDPDEGKRDLLIGLKKIELENQLKKGGYRKRRKPKRKSKRRKSIKSQ